MSSAPALSGPISPGSLVKVVDAHGEAIAFGGPLLVVSAPPAGSGQLGIYSLMTPGGTCLTVYRGHVVPFDTES